MQLTDYSARDRALLATLNMLIRGTPLAHVTLLLLKNRGWIEYENLGDDSWMFALTPLGVREHELYERVCCSEKESDG